MSKRAMQEFLGYATTETLGWIGVERTETWFVWSTPYDDTLKGVIRLYLERGHAVECEFSVDEVEQASEQKDLFVFLARDAKKALGY